MKKKEKILRKKEQGITLIALVITAIVLLILAGVSIAMLAGENGILTQAQRAKNETENAAKEEQNILDSYENYINNATGNEITQVEDGNPGVLEGSGTEQEPFVISSIEDLVVFSNDVTNGNNYEGKYVELGQSLDFNSNLSYVDPDRENYEGYTGQLKTALTTGEGFKSIGITTEDNSEKNFAGIFNGNGNSINNLYINVEDNTDAEFRKIGLFALNYGEISNIYLNDVNINVKSNFPHVGGISGQNTKNGKISNCGVAGLINVYGRIDGRIGGITSYCSGTIDKSYNKAKIIVEYETVQLSGCGVGGIASALGISNEATISQCCNNGTIIIRNNDQENATYIGGIVGVINSETKGVTNCYNSGEMVIDTSNQTTGGGIAGYNVSNVENCYNIGEIDLPENTENIKAGMLVGKNRKTVKNSYYKQYNDYLGIGNGNHVEGITSENDIIKSEIEMKSDSFVTLLNAGSNVWKRNNSKNNGYPILDWQ